MTVAEFNDRPIVVSATRLWDGVSETPTRSAKVLIRNGVIAAVGTRVPTPSETIRIDLDGHTLLPGLIDAHVHSAAHPIAGSAATATDVSRHVIGAIPALRAMLRNGFTLVRDLGGHVEEPITVVLRDAVSEGVLAGPSMLVAPHIISSSAGHGDQSLGLSSGRTAKLGALADGPEPVISRVRSEVRAGADWIKFAASGGFTSAEDGPDDVTYTQQEIHALVSVATDFNRPCAVHAFGDEAVRRSVQAGVRSVEHGLLASAETLQLAHQRGAFLVPTQYVAVRHLSHLDDDDFWSDRPATSRAQLARHADRMRKTMREIARSELRVAFGSDAGMFPHSDNWREFPELVHNGMSPCRALRAATSVAAELLNVADRGRIEPGRRADLVAVSGDPFDDIEVMGEVDFVMQGGCVRFQPGQPHPEPPP